MRNGSFDCLRPEVLYDEVKCGRQKLQRLEDYLNQGLGDVGEEPVQHQDGQCQRQRSRERSVHMYRR